MYKHTFDKTILRSYDIRGIYGKTLTDKDAFMLGFFFGTTVRKKNPDKHVPKGSVAIAEDYTAIYPVNSPGGWNIIGHTEYEILNKKFSIKFKPGDKVKFVSI